MEGPACLPGEGRRVEEENVHVEECRYFGDLGTLTIAILPLLSMSPSATHAYKRGNGSTGKVDMVAPVDAVAFCFELIMPSCTVWPIRLQPTHLFGLYLHPEALRAMYSLVLCSVFNIHSQVPGDSLAGIST